MGCGRGEAATSPCDCAEDDRLLVRAGIASWKACCGAGEDAFESAGEPGIDAAVVPPPYVPPGIDSRPARGASRGEAGTTAAPEVTHAGEPCASDDEPTESADSDVERHMCGSAYCCCRMCSRNAASGSTGCAGG